MKVDKPSKKKRIHKAAQDKVASPSNFSSLPQTTALMVSYFQSVYKTSQFQPLKMVKI